MKYVWLCIDTNAPASKVLGVFTSLEAAKASWRITCSGRGPIEFEDDGASNHDVWCDEENSRNAIGRIEREPLREHADHL